MALLFLCAARFRIFAPSPPFFDWAGLLCCAVVVASLSVLSTVFMNLCISAS